MSHTAELFPTKRILEIQRSPQNFRLLQRIPLTTDGALTTLPIILNRPVVGEKTYPIVFLDTETTGKRHFHDKIIELGMVRCTWSLSRRIIISIDACYDGFEDPGAPLEPVITTLTGITDEMVMGHNLDESKISEMLSGRPLVVAHNAGFDRPFVETRLPGLAGLSWADTLTEIDWLSHGSGGGKLEYLTLSRGWFYDAHRAVTDCLALLWLLHVEPAAFNELIERAMSKTYFVYALGNTFDVKEELKAAGFQFSETKAFGKAWRCSCKDEEEAQSMEKFLRDKGIISQIEPVTAKQRFSKEP